MTLLPKGANLNTLVTLAAFVALAIGWGVTWGNTSNDVAALVEFRRDAEPQLRQLDNLAYRVTASERSNATISQSLEQMKETMNQQSGDLRVMREILQRIERQGQGNAFRGNAPPGGYGNQ